MTTICKRPAARAMAALLLAALAAAHAAPVTTQQDGSSVITIDGAVVAADSGRSIDGRVSTLASAGGGPVAEIRTAARSAVNGELASNVRIDSQGRFRGSQIDVASSLAMLRIEVPADSAIERRASLDFTLPASFVEVTSDVEAFMFTLRMRLQAALYVCLALDCDSEPAAFAFVASLEANYRGFSWSAFAAGDPGLDLDPLRHPLLSDVFDGLDRTVTLDFAEFTGHLDLGLLPPGTPLTLLYLMQTEGSGRAVANLGLAGINDPFVLATDPVRGGMMTLTLTPVVGGVAAPATPALAATGLLLVAAARRRRR